ncbi:3-hydroxyacyl-CoA dehydrogenase family protein [Nocardia sp. BMG51109]|uniref:3-hydroxyacyl-CoA dehydrogenase family protein n=1 Tax=Nocardia sp. BMG51109 TaxID=1056816 RepID=UPI000466BC78|nr:3-hydroxyacyl-CoA dehydrogenase family protein [Nocardia sp. BMG51109]
MHIEHIGVVGSGTMGGGIAEVACRSGYGVVIRSRTRRAADHLLTRLDRSLDKQVAAGRLTRSEYDTALGRVSAVTDLDELASCDLVIEAVVEDLEVKRELFGTLGEICDTAAVLATNTSSLSVADIAAASGRAANVCGIHFFNPVPRMGLVEIVRAADSSDETISAAKTFAESCGKVPIDVRDRTGFVVNALLFPYLNAAVRLLEHGVAGRDEIDAAMREGAGFPMGPFQLLDLVGLDVSVAILDALHTDRPETVHSPAGTLRRLADCGYQGRKNGRGFYDYAEQEAEQKA